MVSKNFIQLISHLFSLLVSWKYSTAAKQLWQTNNLVKIKRPSHIFACKQSHFELTNSVRLIILPWVIHHGVCGWAIFLHSKGAALIYKTSLKYQCEQCACVCGARASERVVHLNSATGVGLVKSYLTASPTRTSGGGQAGSSRYFSTCQDANTRLKYSSPRWHLKTLNTFSPTVSRQWRRRLIFTWSHLL